MIWLRKFFYRRIVKAFEYRLSVQAKLMCDSQEMIAKLSTQISKLEEETPLPERSLKTLLDNKNLWERMYWDAFTRHEEVELGLMCITKDFNRR